MTRLTLHCSVSIEGWSHRLGHLMRTRILLRCARALSLCIRLLCLLRKRENLVKPSCLLSEKVISQLTAVPVYGVDEFRPAYTLAMSNCTLFIHSGQILGTLDKGNRAITSVV